MNEIILATGNAGKIAELEAILAPAHCISQSSLGIDSVEETGLSFVENALLKARHASRISNRPALADDSGLAVLALQGEPGIYSARYAGPDASDEDNITRLLDRLSQTADDQRQAYFYCAIALVQHANDPTPLIACGKVHGSITRKPSGSHGFGYDPVFYLPELGCTMAELATDVKNTLSHRARALQQLKHLLAGHD
ncbi:RdgB/HAM1 family non-canonical purine NTP pyrophosphatase [Legionella sp. CNM-4043-24]|uniref:RdgB/HAM1 family non-canonical purine NTP pyrophosphatase n=1 Tax=Legionella sp. CNM-4043-24 TaxID=3421646 RepID=UPI00403AC1E6